MLQDYLLFLTLSGEITMNLKLERLCCQVKYLGRIVIPNVVPKTLYIEEKDPVEVYVEKDSIILKKYKPNMTCAITGGVSEILNGQLILSTLGEST